MEDPVDPFAEFIASLQVLWTNVSGFLFDVVEPGWRRNQVLIIIAVAPVAWADRFCHAGLHGWTMTTIRGHIDQRR